MEKNKTQTQKVQFVVVREFSGDKTIPRSVRRSDAQSAAQRLPSWFCPQKTHEPLQTGLFASASFFSPQATSIEQRFRWYLRQRSPATDIKKPVNYHLTLISYFSNFLIKSRCFRCRKHRQIIKSLYLWAFSISKPTIQQQRTAQQRRWICGTECGRMPPAGTSEGVDCLTRKVCCWDGCRLVAGFVAAKLLVLIQKKPINKGFL